MNIHRSPKKQSHRNKSFKEATVYTVGSTPWTGSTTIDVDIALKDDIKRSTIVRMIITEDDAMSVFNGLVDGYKKELENKSKVIEMLQKELDDAKKVSYVQLELDI